MKYFVIVLIFTGIGLVPFTLLTVHADCPPNNDWHDAPCLDQTNPDLLEKAKKEWARYAYIKSEKSLEISKTEMINAIQHDVLEEWLHLRNSLRNQNAYTYFSIYDANMNDYFELSKKNKFDGTCIILIDLKNAEEILRDDKTIVRFFEMYPDAVSGPVGGIDESSPPQSSVSFVSKNVVLYVRVFESREGQCFVPVSYKIVSNNDKIEYYIRDAEISNLYPVLKQLKAGLVFDELVCPDKLILIKKYDGSPACVKPETKQKLVEMGWTKTNSIQIRAPVSVPAPPDPMHITINGSDVSFVIPIKTGETRDVDILLEPKIPIVYSTVNVENYFGSAGECKDVDINSYCPGREIDMVLSDTSITSQKEITLTITVSDNVTSGTYAYRITADTVFESPDGKLRTVGNSLRFDLKII